MKRNLDQEMLNIDGKPFSDKATLKTVLFQAITAPLEADQRLPAEKKMQLYSLAQRIHLGGVAEFTAEELALLKDRVNQCYPIVVVGAAFTILEQEPLLSVVESGKE